ncbi:MFS multidrug transporter-like protein [Xylogone sp. PMI_703]|nr:MFS multidrug transporter-like protein [Xylogone sp. PMI_703]
MNEIDQRISNNERDASPERFGSHQHQHLHAESSAIERPSHEIERTATVSSTSSSSSEASSVAQRPSIVSRASTQRDLERNPTMLSRIQTAKSQHTGTTGGALATRTRDSKRPLPEFGGGKPYPPPLPEREAYVVEFDGPDDPLHAQNWPLRKKVLTAVMLGYTTLLAAFTSSIFSTATTTIARQYHVSTEVGLLGLSLYVLGFALGPTFWAPLSELRGRRLPIVISMFGFSIFQVAVAAAKDLQTIMLCRFFGGLFASCPLAVVAAVFSDMFNNRTRGLAITVFSVMVFTGPLLAPFIGGFIVESHLGWRWTEWLTAILGFSAFILDLLFLEETYPPVILISKATELRRRTKNWGIHAKQEEIEVDFRELVTKNFSRPMRLLFTEPIVLLLSIYMAFIYGLLYLFLTAYPIVFQQIHGFTPGVGGLPYFGMIIGQLLASIYIMLTQPSYNRKLAANNGIPIPEWRLPPVIVGGVAFAIGLFWFGWTGYTKDIHWIVPTLSGLFTGFGLLAIFLQALNYLVDAYLMFAASAIAANTFLRSLAGAGFPLFSQYMFKALHVNWTGTLLGCVAAVLVPIPIGFYYYGATLRKKSAFAPTALDNLADADDAEEPEIDLEKVRTGSQRATA